LKKMLVGDNLEMNKIIISEIFGKEYEIIYTSSSEEFLHLLMHYKDDADVILVNQYIAKSLSSEKIELLEKLNVFKNTPVILILDQGHSNRKNTLALPFSDVVHSPVNPYTVKQRVQNLTELFRIKETLENQVQKQMKKILEQNEALKNKEKKINSINNDMLDVLSMVIEYRDVESGKHIRRIQKFTEALLRILSEKYPKYNIDDEKIALITSASSMHDIGKIAIPDSILLKPGRLTPEEFQIMKQHTSKGCEILEQIDSVEKNDYYKYCYDICHYHHEKWDGLGYPEGLAGDNIPIWAQVVAIADCYDALTSRRSYKDAFSHEKAVEMIRDGACGAFSDEILDCFSMVLPKFKALALKYADKDTDEKENPIQKYLSDKNDTNDIYSKMSKNDLINMIEHQKGLLRETHQQDTDVFYAGTDYVFEFDLSHDTVHERKGNIKDICGYIPKNYEEAVNLLSESCVEDYKNEFLRKFRLKNIDTKTVIFECLVRLSSDDISSVRVTAVPIADADGKITKIFLSIIELHDTVFNNIYRTSKNYDTITGLFNLNGIKKEIDDYLSNTGRNGYHLMILVDGDDFRKINQSTSYKFGNEILAVLAAELKKQIPENALIARVEDDNFLIFIKDCPDREECLLVLEDVFRAYKHEFKYSEEVTVHTTSSVGAVLYPYDGSSFDILFENASKTVELVKLNGKNMYMFYNPGMRDEWEIDKHNSSDLANQENSLISMNLEKYLMPVINSGNGHIISYDFIEILGDTNDDFSYTYNLSGENMSAFSLGSIDRLISEIYAMQQENISVPKLSLITSFESSDSTNITDALHKILHKYPLAYNNICLMLSQDMVDGMSLNSFSAFSAELKNMGFETGVYNFGSENFNIKCFADGFFDRIVFSLNFLRDISQGIYPPDLIAYFISYFSKAGIVPEMPSGISDELIRLIKQKTSVDFGIHKQQLISLEDFKNQMKTSAVVSEYPVLSHENTSLILSEKMYDEILEQTKSFIMEWTPRSDKIKISGSFKKLYGYEPDFEDFIKNLHESRMIHHDDIAKFLEKINSARSENSYSETFIRVYDKNNTSYSWNKVKFVAIRNSAGIPVKVIAVFADVSDESDSFLDDKRKDRTDFITNLYNKRVTENKIKNCLHDEGSFTSNSLILAEIINYDELENSLGTVFANAVLKETAENIKELFRDTDIIGKSSGNKFIIFVKGMGYCSKLTEKAEQVCAVIKNKYHSENGDITIFGKAGISVFPHDGATYDELYANAFKALDLSKNSKNKNVSFPFDSENNQKLLHD